VAQAAAVEDVVWLTALRRSAELTRERYPHVFALSLSTGLVAVAAIFGARELPLGSSSGLASVAVGIAVNSVTASFVALTLALLYFDLRARSVAPAGRVPEHQHLRDLD
jgi:hypothetical protein